MTSLLHRAAHPHVRTAPPDRFDRRLVAPMILGSILNPINSSMLAVALVPIATAFGVASSQTAWLVTALYLATAVGQPVVGRLIDMFGPRTLFLAGTGLVGVAGILGAVAPNLGVLIVARVLLGFGTCAGYPASMYLIGAESRRTGHDSPNGILSALTISNQVIAVIGPTLGGFLVSGAGWRSVFTVNIPLSAACLVLGSLWLPRGLGASGRTGDDADAGRQTQGIDLAGMVLFSGALVALMLFVMDPHASDAWLVVVAAALGTGFAWRELRTSSPFIDLRVLGGNVPQLATYARQLLAATVQYSLLYGFTQWLEAGRGLSASGAGLLLMPMFASAIVVTAVTGRHAEVRGKLVAGGIFQVLVCAALLLVTGDTAIWFLVAIGLVFGLPQGLNGLANQNALYRQADPTRMASAAGLLRTVAYVGALASSAATAAFFGERATTAGLHDLAWFTLGCGVVFLVLTLVDRSLARIGRATTSAAS
ncbi:MAG TPA: MFS transporter [Luteimicrobium sp.]|nr:MFS transporter [Luteimicrobium sp.]